MCTINGMTFRTPPCMCYWKSKVAVSSWRNIPLVYSICHRPHKLCFVCSSNYLINFLQTSWQRGITEVIFGDRRWRILLISFRIKQNLYEIFKILYNPQSRVLLEKLIVSQLVEKFPRTLWNPNVHHRIHQFPPPVRVWAKSIQSMLTIPLPEDPS